ncbi:PepSY-like domain-containing protein [Sphingobacterium sp. lm-10]|uniref:PepSY-like domain-containing protein n=1 Tax=Sphingobacterium sp. lm-10 TaxID=2944904 RepID=UPI0020204F17|nr:PepSY-like domain-containing protein [Sphingobacterium sp. lm-10]MCL7987850.1 PepSY-like domain-containing protein [Sphingobacterium sp. lm-10]
MKNVILNTLVLITMAVATMSCDKEETIQSDELPVAANAFLTTHFTDVRISNVKKEREGLSGREYTVYLSNGTEVVFDKDGNWTDVDGPRNEPIPYSFIPAPIIAYVAENYPSEKITSIEKDRNEIDVELTNGFDLVFDSNGAFKRMD